MNLDILCIGSSGFDVFISGRDIKPNKFSLEDKIDLINDTKYKIDHAIYEAGGTALNSSILFSRQGFKTGCLSRTGKDHLANQIKIISKHENIETSLIVSKAEHHTDINIHLVNERSHEIRLEYLNSALSLRSRDVKIPKLKAELIYFSEMPDDFKIFKYYSNWSKVNKSKIAINILDFKNYKKRQINYVISNSDLLMMPIKTAKKYFGNDLTVEETTRVINGIGAKSVVLYDVVSNSYAFEDSTLFKSPPYKKINPLDFTGSEDVFAAGYMAGKLSNSSVPECLTLASANACSVMEIYGARIAILRKPALRTLTTETKTL